MYISYDTLKRTIFAKSNGSGSVQIDDHVFITRMSMVQLDFKGKIVFTFESTCSLHYTKTAENWEIKYIEKPYSIPLSVRISNVLSALFEIKLEGRKVSLEEYTRRFLISALEESYNRYSNKSKDYVNIDKLLESKNENELLLVLNRSSNWISLRELPINTKIIHNILRDMNIIKQTKFFNKCAWEPYDYECYSYSKDKVLKANDYCITFVSHEYIPVIKEFYNIATLYNRFFDNVSDNDIFKYFESY